MEQFKLEKVDFIHGGGSFFPQNETLRMFKDLNAYEQHSVLTWLDMNLSSRDMKENPYDMFSEEELNIVSIMGQRRVSYHEAEDIYKKEK